MMRFIVPRKGKMKKLTIILLSILLISCQSEVEKGDGPIIIPGIIPVEESCESEVCQVVLNQVNEIRSQVASGEVPNWPASSSLQPLEWDQNLADSAEVYAQNCEYGVDSNRTQRAQEFGVETTYVGQTIAVLGQTDLAIDSISRAVSNWEIEADESEYSQCGGQACGNFTQLIWEQTSHIGCAAISCQDVQNLGPQFANSTLLVCFYSQGGNINGQYPYTAL
jgi:hypothetical protein